MKKEQFENIMHDLAKDNYSSNPKHFTLKCMERAYQLDRTPTLSVEVKTPRFEIENSGKQLLKFETEAHIKDIENPDCTIIVQSGYTTLKETDEYADKIVKILNYGSI